MNKRNWISCALIGAVAFTAACGSDSTTRPGQELSTQQLQSMSSALTTLLGLSLGRPESNRTAPSAFNARRTASDLAIGGSVACPEGGRVGTSGSFADDSAGNSVFALSDTLVACAIRDNHSDVWTFTSKPTLSVTIVDSTNIHGDSIDTAHSAFSQTDLGTLQYSTGSLSGSCAIDMSIVFTVDDGVPTADSATVSLHSRGTICGRSVSRDTSSTLPYTLPHFQRTGLTKSKAL